MGFTDIFRVKSSKGKKKPVKVVDYVEIGEGKYFKELDKAYLNSPTATMALLKFNEFCVPLNLRDDYQKLWKKVENDFIRYGYYILNVAYDVDGNVRADEIIYRDCKNYLVKDVDDNGNASTFVNIKTGVVYPAFNSNKKVVKAQINDVGFPKFKGQIYMYNDSSLPYRVTPLYSVLNWMNIEANSGTFVSKTCDNAMFGNSIFVMKKSSSASEKEEAIIEEVKETLSSVKGVDEANQNILLEYQGDIEDVTKLLTKISISNDADVDLLNAVDDKAEAKICLACYGFPRILISQSEGIFGNSGEAINVATEKWAATCQKEAQNILDGFKEIGYNLLQAEEVEEVSAGTIEEEVFDDITLEAQANLKGSVGGVQSILSIQASFSAGTTTFESAIAMLIKLFGFSRDESIQLLGNPETNTSGSTDDTDNTTD